MNIICFGDSCVILIFKTFLINSCDTGVATRLASLFLSDADSAVVLVHIDCPKHNTSALAGIKNRLALQSPPLTEPKTYAHTHTHTP